MWKLEWMSLKNFFEENEFKYSWNSVISCLKICKYIFYFFTSDSTSTTTTNPFPEDFLL